MNYPKVEQFEHKNQFLIITNEEYILQSYDSTVAKINRNDRSITLLYDFDYSITTLRHVYEFIYKYGDINIAERRLFLNLEIEFDRVVSNVSNAEKH